MIIHNKYDFFCLKGTNMTLNSYYYKNIKPYVIAYIRQ